MPVLSGRGGVLRKCGALACWFSSGVCLLLLVRVTFDGSAATFSSLTSSVDFRIFSSRKCKQSMSENPMAWWQNLPRVTITRIPKPPSYDDTYGKPYRELLLENERSVRLLVLQPAKNKDQHLFCEIMHASLDEPPFYEALSYAWDSEIPQAFLTCPDGSQILVTLNCEAALQGQTSLPLG